MNEQLKQLQERFKKLNMSVYAVAKLVHERYPDKISARQANRILSNNVKYSGVGRPITRIEYVEKVIKELENELTRNTK